MQGCWDHPHSRGCERFVWSCSSAARWKKAKWNVSLLLSCSLYQKLSKLNYKSGRRVASFKWRLLQAIDMWNTPCWRVAFLQDYGHMKTDFLMWDKESQVLQRASFHRLLFNDVLIQLKVFVADWTLIFIRKSEICAEELRLTPPNVRWGGGVVKVSFHCLHLDTHWKTCKVFTTTPPKIHKKLFKIQFLPPNHVGPPSLPRHSLWLLVYSFTVYTPEFI